MIENKFGDWGANDYADYRGALNHFLDEESFAEYNDLPPVGKRGTARKKAKAAASRERDNHLRCYRNKGYKYDIHVGENGLTFRVTGYAPADIYHDQKYADHIEEAKKIGAGKNIPKKSTLAHMARG